MPVEKEQFEEIIRQLIPISELSESARNDVINAAEILEFKKKKFVFKEGDEDNYSYYILAGELELIVKSDVHNTVTGGAENARYALAQLQPRQFSAKAKTPITILRLDRDTLDRLMVHEGNKETEISDTGIEVEVSQIEEEDSGDWMTRMLQSELFARLPMANIQQLFAFLEPVALKAGDTVIKQGEPGDNYYIIQEGTCEVTRVPEEGKEPVKLVEMTVGESFGEESLLTDSTRNATVTMLTDGILMQLNKDNFVDLIKKPSLSSVSFEQARQIVEEGGEWIDVRFAKEYEVSNIEASTNIPLNAIRAQVDKFNPDTHYVFYCDTGGRSSSAAFLLAKEGFHVSYLKGGFVSDSQVAQVKSTEKVAETGVEIIEEATIEEEIIDSAVKVSALETDLAKNKMELEAADKKQKEASEQADKNQRAAHEKERKKLEQEKIEIERQKKLAEEEVNKKRREEEEKIEKSKKDAESRMQDQKEKLEEIYEKNTEEMEKLQEMKAKAEEQIRKAREQLEKEVKESKRELAEVRSLKSSVEEAKKKIDREAEEQRVKQAELEKSVKANTKALLEKERRKLAEKIAQNNEELQQAKQEKAIAEAGRAAAKEEAEKIIEEYKAQFEEEKAELEASLKAERAKLENEAQQIRDKLNEVHKSREEAEVARKVADEEAIRLKAKQALQLEKGDNEDKALTEEMRHAEKKLEEAKRLLDDAHHEVKMTKVAKEEIDEDLLRQNEEEEKLNRQLEAELNAWKKEEEKKQEQFKGQDSQAEHIKRIHDRAMAAKNITKESEEDLFADVSAQISDVSHHKLR